jgi:glutamate synthase (NADPH/NADH) large chain
MAAFEQRVNPETLLWRRLGGSAHWEGVLRDHIGRHVRETGSPFAARLLNNWEVERARFWHVVPKDYARYLPKPMEDAPAVAAE